MTLSFSPRIAVMLVTHRAWRRIASRARVGAHVYYFAPKDD